MSLVHKKRINNKKYVRGAGHKKIVFHAKNGGNIGEFFKNAIPLDYIAQFAGKNALNWGINNLPVELHLRDNDGSKYSACGPGTKLGGPGNPQRITWDDAGNPIKINTPPKNNLDSACFLHDLAYNKYKDVQNRNIADEHLRDAAGNFSRNDAKTRLDRVNASIVHKIMNYKIQNKV